MQSVFTIYYSRTFLKNFTKLPLSVKKLTAQKEKVFQQNPWAPTLKTHKLTGKIQEFYAFSVNYEYRILFSLEKNGDVTFINIGTHSIYK